MNKEYEVSLILPEHLEDVWLKCEKILKRSCQRSYGRINTIDILYKLGTEECNLWIIFEQDNVNVVGCIITQVHTYPSGLKMLHIEHLAGKHMDNWVYDGVDVLYEYAKDNNCDGVEGIGREGFWNWIRKKDLGWKETARFFEFRFDGEKT